MQNVIGLFGTCDGSMWRSPFEARYADMGIDYFNPVVEDWDPSCAEIENQHLREDSVILFPVLGESLGLGSLGEIGFSINTVIRNLFDGFDQRLIVLIDDICTDERKTEAERKESNRARKLVKSKLLEVKHPNILVVGSMDDMFEASIMANDIQQRLANVRTKFSIV